jgi:hypothetical protein
MDQGANSSGENFSVIENIKRGSCYEILKMLFFSETRTSVFRARRLEMEENLRSSMKIYINNCYNSGFMINKVDLFTFFYNKWKSFNFLMEAKGSDCVRIIERTPALIYKEKIVDEIVDVIMKQFCFICTTPWAVNDGGKNKIIFINNFPSFVLAVLRIMGRRGKTLFTEVGYLGFKVVVIPPNDYVRKYAPPNYDLGDYGFEKKMITHGANMISNAYESLKDTNFEIPGIITPSQPLLSEVDTVADRKRKRTEEEERIAKRKKGL